MTTVALIFLIILILSIIAFTVLIFISIHLLRYPSKAELKQIQDPEIKNEDSIEDIENYIDKTINEKRSQ